MTCPAQLSANDSAAGYYLSFYPDALLHKLLESGNSFLNPAERRTLLHDLRSLADSGDTSESRLLEALPQFAKAPERQIVSEAQNAAASVRRFVPATLRPNYARYVRKNFGQRAAELGWSAKPDDDKETRLLRSNLVPFVATAGEDQALQAQARRLAEGWLKDRKGVDPDMLGSVLSTAAANGDRKLFDTMVTELKKTQDRQLRSAIIGALASFHDPKIIQSAEGLALSPEYDPREIIYTLFAGQGEPGTERLPFDFLRSHYDEIVKRLPTGGGFDAGAMLPFLAGGLCDAGSRSEYVSFFQSRVKNFTGGPRNYEQVLEGIKLCEARKAAQDADIAAFFTKE